MRFAGVNLFACPVVRSMCSWIIERRATREKIRMPAINNFPTTIPALLLDER